MFKAAIVLTLLTFPITGVSQTHPFTIQIEDSIHKDLEVRLSRTRLPDQLEGSGWDYGSDHQYMEELLEYWRNQYNWRKHEAQLNELDHFKTKIQGIDMHFIHVRSKHSDALPLVITHGWPGSVYEFMDVTGPLTNPEAHGGTSQDAFHLVMPSMPGYGFSGHTKKRDMSVDRVADVVGELMGRLGYENYGAQGGDWGSGVASWLGHNNPKQVVGIHLNMVGGGPP